MKILIIHNRYNTPGGEDAVVLEEAELLRERGHTIIEYIADNRTIIGFFDKVKVAIACVFSVRVYVTLLKLLRHERPDVVHVHNFFPLISPAVFYACSRARVPVVFTLHNFRVICPTTTLHWRGEVQERSLTDGPWWTVRARVYRGSLLGSFFLALMVSAHRKLGTWRKRVTRFVVLTEFAKAKFAEAGLPVALMSVKPNFVREPKLLGQQKPGYFFYAGRITEDKGVPELIDAVKGTELQLRLAGPAEIPMLCGGMNIQYLGLLERAELERQIAGAIALVVPSKWYEGFPRVLVEAYAVGVPVIASDLGSLRELVSPGETGLLVPPGDRDLLRNALEWAENHPEKMKSMGANARARYEALYGPDANYALLKIYIADAIAESNADRVLS